MRTADLLRALPCVLLLTGCPAPSPTPDAMDGGDVVGTDATPDVPMDVPVDAPPPAPGSNEALTLEACMGQPASSAEVRYSYATGDAMGRLQNTAPGDLEAVHLIPTEPTRIQRLRVFVRGGAGGQARIHLMGDYARSQPNIDVDLIPPIMVDWRENGWVDLPLETTVLLHPARHAWIVFEHVTEPMGFGVGMASGTGRVSMVRSQAIIDNLRAMGEMFFEWVGVSDTADYLGEAIGVSVCGPRRNPWFSNQSMPAGLDPLLGDASWADVDGDGWDDVVGVRRAAMMPDRPGVLRNRHDGTFEPWTDRAGLTNAWGTLSIYADYDGDGDLDLFLADNQPGLGPFEPTRGSRVWTQGTDQRFTMIDATLENPGPSASAAAGDCDGDGILDLVVGQWLRQYPQNPAPDFILRGMGDGRFTNITAMTGVPAAGNGRPTYGTNWADFDNDGDLDLFIANYGGTPNELWQNDGRCRLRNIATRGGIANDANAQAGTSFGFELADYDNDGDLDAFESNIGHPRYDVVGTDHSRLLQNSGSPEFTWREVTEGSGIQHIEGDIEGSFGDYDNDGDLDLYVASTYPWQYGRLYRQEADHTFVDVTYLAGVATEINGRASWYDYDRDGDLDLLAAPSGRQVLFRNELTTGNHWIQVRLRAPAPNTFAVGARIYVEASNAPTRMRDVSAGRSTYGTQSPYLQHFGLGNNSGTVTVRVRWPDRMETRYDNVAVDRVYRITRGEMPVAE